MLLVRLVIERSCRFWRVSGVVRMQLSAHAVAALSIIAIGGSIGSPACSPTGIRHSRMPDFGTAPLRLLGTGFGYLNFLGRSCREPFGGDQNASICLIRKQSEQLRLFLVGLRKR